MPVHENIDIRSEGIRDFISHRPGFLIRWGILIFFLILVVLFAASYFIQYPDIVHASARINSLNPPKQVIVKTGGRLIKLLGGDNQDVKKGDIIGYIESTADHSEVLRLSSVLDTLQYFADNNKLEEMPEFWISVNQPFAHLGELQQYHQTFIQGFIICKDYLSKGFYVTKKKMLSKDLTNTKKLLEILYQQKELQQQDLALIQKNFDVHDTLHNEAVINDIDYRGQKSQLINKKMNIPQINASIIGNENQQNSLRKEMLELDNQITQQKEVFVQLLNSYRNSVEEWERKFLLIAPVNGKLIYAGFLDENQQLKEGQIIGYIASESNKYFVEMLIPQTNFGKVKIGEDVLLKFPSYPVQEFGSVEGKIEFIKSIPTDSGYLSRVALSNGLVTNYKKIIPFTEGLKAQAEIITKKKRLSDRFLSGMESIFK